MSRALPSDGGGSQRGERRKRGGEGGNELVPFSLEEIPCIVSETVSGNSSPFRCVCVCICVCECACVVIYIYDFENHFIPKPKMFYDLNVLA